MSQHLGAPCKPLVAKGDRVVRGQMIGDVDAMISAPIHSPVSGEVVDVGPALSPAGVRVESVTIAPDAEQDLAVFKPIDASRDDVKAAVRAAGIVGLGGAAFPSAVKLSPPKQSPIDTLILNGCECEPYLTCDHRLMLERPEAIVAGARLIAATVGARSVFIGVEDNKPDAIAALQAAASGAEVEVATLKTHYPQGAEKQLIYAITGRAVPRGQLPSAVGVLVHNVATAIAVAEAVEQGKPLMERVVTVAGSVARPGNYLALIGTPLSALVEAAGGPVGDVGRIVAGGPMTGQPLHSLDVPVVKGTSGVVVLTSAESAPMVDGDQPCIRCGRCVEACPMTLHPFQIASYADRRMWSEVERYYALDCIECGCCSYVCPTRRPLVQLIKLGKAALMAKGVKQ
jgi:electron transport complex protein RnfC